MSVGVEIGVLHDGGVEIVAQEIGREANVGIERFDAIDHRRRLGRDGVGVVDVGIVDDVREQRDDAVRSR